MSAEEARGPAPVVGTEVVHRRYVSDAQAHYAGSLVDGAWGLGLFGDVATEMCIRTDGDEGLFAGYSRVEFHSAVRAGDVVSARGVLVRVGRRSRELELQLHVVARRCTSAESGAQGGGASRMLEVPLLATSATGTVVVPGPEKT